MRDGSAQAAGRGEFFGAQECPLGLFFCGDVAKDEHDADEIAVAVTDGRGAVIDGDLSAVFADEECVICQPDDGALAAHLFHWVFYGELGVFVDDTEDCREIEAACLGFVPSGELLRHGIHEGDAAFRVAGDDGVANATQSGVKPLPARQRFFIEGFGFIDALVIAGMDEMKGAGGAPDNQRADADGENEEGKHRHPVEAFEDDGASLAEFQFAAHHGFAILQGLMHRYFLRLQIGQQA